MPAWIRGLTLLAMLCVLCALAVARAQANSVEEMGREVERLFRAGKYAEGIQLGDRALAQATATRGPDHPEVGHALYRLGVLHRSVGKLDLAEDFATRALAVMEKAHGPDHVDVAKAVTGLAAVRGRRGDLEGAQALDRRAIAIYERALGPDHPQLADALNNLAGSYFLLGKYDLAEPLWRRTLVIREKAYGEIHADVAQSLFNVAIVRWFVGDMREAETLLQRGLKVEEATVGTEHPTHAKTITTLAAVYRQLGRDKESEALYLRGLAIQEKALGPDHAQVAETLVGLGNLYFDQARYALAEPAFQRAIAIFEAVGMGDHFFAASALGNLSGSYLQQGRFAESEPLLLRALAIKEKHLGPDHHDVADLRKNLGSIRIGQGRFEEAEQHLRGAVAIYEKIGALHVPNGMLALDELGRALTAARRPADAAPVLERAFALRVKTLGAAHPNVASSLVSLGNLDLQRQDFDAAAERFVDALAIRQAAWGFEHPSIAEALDGIALADAGRGRDAAALRAARHATALLAARYAQASGHAGAGLRSEQRERAQRFANHVRLLDRVRTGDHGGELHEALRVAQLARASDTAAQVARMAARFGARDDRLASLVRDRQDEENRLARTEAQLLEAWSRPADGESAGRTAELRATKAQAETRLAQIEATLQNEFPRYRELVSPQPLELAELQALLRRGEALVSYLVADDAAYVWVVRRDAAAFRRLETNRAGLARAVGDLRRSLDPAGDPARVLQQPFQADAARALYRDVLAPVQPALAGVRHLIVVPDGPLQSVPFAVLLTDAVGAPLDKDLSRAAWLIKRHAISVLPAESSLRALRAFATTRTRGEPFGGFGDPLLDGPAGLRGAIPVALRARGAAADVNEVRRLPRLPDTADELQSIAATLKAAPGAIFLRERATERAVKSTDLARYRTLAFATHGLLAGELQGLGEPALVLTPPPRGDDLDNGLLTASEVAQLKLDADWVILSACNTAADDGRPGAEGLSGLAKAFFFAGARSLLVSHWGVSSEAAVALTTGMFRNVTAGHSKAEALRRSMLELMQRKGRLPYAHPMLWAPFVVVGEGAAPEAGAVYAASK